MAARKHKALLATEQGECEMGRAALSRKTAQNFLSGAKIRWPAPPGRLYPAVMRQRFELHLALGKTPIEKVVVPLKSRDELPPILAGLQWIFVTPEINTEIFARLEQKVLAGKKATGRPGLSLWHILVLGVVRLGLDCDYDRLEYLANYDSLLRQILGLSAVPSADEKPFHYKTLSENVALVDEELLKEINAIVVQAGRASFKKKKAVPMNRFAPRPTPTCWKPMCISRPT